MIILMIILPIILPIIPNAIFQATVTLSNHTYWKLLLRMLGGRLVVSGVIYWSRYVEGSISVGMMYINY